MKLIANPYNYKFLRKMMTKDVSAEEPSAQDPTLSHLRAQGYRLTPQRLTILEVLDHAGCHLTPQEVFTQARARLPGLTEATVYRTLTFLSEHGLIQPSHMGGGQLAYELSEHAHHHLVCRECGRSVEIEHQYLRQLYRRLEEETGFTIESPHHTFFGTCPDCNPDA